MTQSLVNTAPAEEQAPETNTPDASGESSAELILGKFKDQDALIESYKSLETKLREKRPEAPEAYDFSFDDNIELSSLAKEIDFATDPLASKMIAKFKEANLPQEQASALIGEYLSYIKSTLPDPGEEIKKLGSDSDNLLRTARYAMTGLSPEATQAFEELTSTANGVKALNELVGKYREKGIPDASTGQKPQGNRNSAEVYAEAKDLRAQLRDHPYDKKLEQAYNDKFKLAMELEQKGL